LLESHVLTNVLGCNLAALFVPCCLVLDSGNACLARAHLLIACLMPVHSVYHLASVYRHHIAGLTCRHVPPQGGYGGYDQGYGSYGTGSGSQSNVPAAVANAAQSLPAESQQKLANIVAKVRTALLISVGALYCHRQSVSIAAFALYGGESQFSCSGRCMLCLYLLDAIHCHTACICRLQLASMDQPQHRYVMCVEQMSGSIHTVLILHGQHNRTAHAALPLLLCKCRCLC